MASRKISRVVLFPVRAYQRLISPLLPPSCRFFPSCSSYCCEAIETHGVLAGGYLALKRCLKCHPWHPGGLDPVPPKENCTRVCEQHRNHSQVSSE